MISSNCRFQFKLPVCTESQTKIDQWLDQAQSEHGVDLDQFVLINPGGSWASKRWEVERYGEVAAELKRRLGLPSIVVWAGDNEQQMANKIVASSAGAA